MQFRKQLEVGRQRVGLRSKWELDVLRIPNWAIGKPELILLSPVRVLVRVDFWFYSMQHTHSCVHWIELELKRLPLLLAEQRNFGMVGAPKLVNHFRVPCVNVNFFSICDRIAKYVKALSLVRAHWGCSTRSFLRRIPKLLCQHELVVQHLKRCELQMLMSHHFGHSRLRSGVYALPSGLGNVHLLRWWVFKPLLILMLNGLQVRLVHLLVEVSPSIPSMLDQNIAFLPIMIHVHNFDKFTLLPVLPHVVDLFSWFDERFDLIFLLGVVLIPEAHTIVFANFFALLVQHHTSVSFRFVSLHQFLSHSYHLFQLSLSLILP
mmetsp:Transcript_21117/g.29597  ORF Transcript_21117/g.29597 Transcript_21117/m.29597 type:complete len:320 (+) Transcript_21117:468-1427(+)